MTFLKSMILVSFVLVMTTIPAQAKTKFPSFNLEKDMLTLVETGLFFSNTDRPVKLDKKNYILNIDGGIFTSLRDNLRFALILERFPVDKLNKNGIKPFLEVYSDGLKDKTLAFDLGDMVEAILKVIPEDTLTVQESKDFLVNVSEQANEMQVNRPTLFTALTNLTDLENRKNLITKTELSADGLTQTYKLDLGTTFVLFTVKKA